MKGKNVILFTKKNVRESSTLQEIKVYPIMPVQICM